MSTKKILSFVTCFSIIIAQNLFGMTKPDELKNTLRALSSLSLLENDSALRNTKQGRQLSTIEMYDKATIGVIKKIKELEEKLEKCEADGVSKGDIEKITKQKEACEKLLENIGTLETNFLTNISNTNFDRKIGIILAKLFAGSDRNSLDEDEISGLWSGLAQGLSVPAGVIMRKRAEATIDTYVGGLWDFIFAGLGNFASMVRNVLFHDSNEPFDAQKLLGWQKMILMAYDDIDNMLRNGLRDSTRSLDSVSRQFDDNGTEVQVKKEIDMWTSLASGYAEQFAYFVTLFEKRQEYYDEDDIVVFYSNQICQMLQTTCKLLTNSKSLKDLDTKLESQRTIIPAIRKNLCNLFDQLIAEVRPKSTSIKDTVANTASTYKPSSYNAYSGANAYGYNNDGPTSFAGGF